jgi:hypothetical protein
MDVPAYDPVFLQFLDGNKIIIFFMILLISGVAKAFGWKPVVKVMDVFRASLNTVTFGRFGKLQEPQGTPGAPDARSYQIPGPGKPQRASPTSMD